jgi:hypothetical protein
MKAEEWRKKKTVRVVAVADNRRYYKKKQLNFFYKF